MYSQFHAHMIVTCDWPAYKLSNKLDYPTQEDVFIYYDTLICKFPKLKIEYDGDPRELVYHWLVRCGMVKTDQPLTDNAPGEGTWTNGNGLSPPFGWY